MEEGDRQLQSLEVREVRVPVVGGHEPLGLRHGRELLEHLEVRGAEQLVEVDVGLVVHRRVVHRDAVDERQASAHRLVAAFALRDRVEAQHGVERPLAG